MPPQEVNATLLAEQPNATMLPLLADAAGALTVADAAAATTLASILSSLQSVLTELQSKLDAGGIVALDAPTLAALEAVTATVSGTVDIRPLTVGTDAVRSVDAAEQVGLTAAPFTISATGTATLVAAPGVGNGKLRLRRLSPTYAVRSPDSEPILALKVGAVEAQRGNALTGRFDIPAAAETDAITLDVDVLDAAGRVTGTVYYSISP